MADVPHPKPASKIWRDDDPDHPLHKKSADEYFAPQECKAHVTHVMHVSRAKNPKLYDAYRAFANKAEIDTIPELYIVDVKYTPADAQDFGIINLAADTNFEGIAISRFTYEHAPMRVILGSLGHELGHSEQKKKYGRALEGEEGQMDADKRGVRLTGKEMALEAMQWFMDNSRLYQEVKKMREQYSAMEKEWETSHAKVAASQAQIAIDTKYPCLHPGNWLDSAVCHFSHLPSTAQIIKEQQALQKRFEDEYKAAHQNSRITFSDPWSVRVDALKKGK